MVRNPPHHHHHCHNHSPSTTADICHEVSVMSPRWLCPGRGTRGVRHVKRTRMSLPKWWWNAVRVSAPITKIWTCKGFIFCYRLMLIIKRRLKKNDTWGIIYIRNILTSGYQYESVSRFSLLLLVAYSAFVNCTVRISKCKRNSRIIVIGPIGRTR